MNEHFNEDLFKGDIKNQSWAIATENDDTYLTFETFYAFLIKC